MGKTPAVVIVVRHGARLDAADKSWHLTSPTPYDPPLTYGGWIQSRALGLRIARLLREREKKTTGSTDSGLAIHDFALHEPAAKSDQKPRKKTRKHKVVVHSSPFQRCVQTSIGISAGLSQFQGLSSGGRKSSDTRVKTVSQLRNSPRLHAADQSSSPKLQPVPELHSDPRDYFRRVRGDQKPYKATLRLDAFLGEWLSPEYFEMITPPPNSTMMIAAAKGELLRKADNINTFTPSSPKTSGNLWGANQNQRQHSASVSVATPSPLSHETDGPLENWRVLSRSLPRRTSSVGSGRKSPEKFRPAHPSPGASRHEHSPGYTPPVPTYAISPGDPIPRGYVAHARDQCVDIDAKWDSMRDPHCWGDGGTFGEEWSQMHKRFRRGINNMVDWYGRDEDQTTPTGEEVHENDEEHEAVPEADLEDDEDLVLVLVTHAAGCNALFGALTSQPVLLDFGMASLTMAVRKDDASPSNSENTPIDSPATGSPALGPVDSLGRPVPRRRSSVEYGISSFYDLNLIASTDHLRPGVDPAKLSTPAMASPSMSASNTIPQSRTRRFGSASSHASAGSPVDSNWNSPEPRPRLNSSLGSVRRASRPVITPVASSPTLGSAEKTDSPTGLWSPMSGKGNEAPSLINPLGRANSVGGRVPTLQKEAIERSVSPKSVETVVKAAETDAVAVAEAVAGTNDDRETKALLEEARSTTSELAAVSGNPPGKLGRALSQRGLWGSSLSDVVPRETGIPKRRWTVAQD